MVCLDTSTIVDFLNGHSRTIELIRSYEAHNERIATTVVSVYELLRDASESKAAEIEALLSSLYIYDLNDLAARRSLEIYKRLKARGSMINQPDILITGIAAANDELLVASDSDFKKTGYEKVRIVEK